MGKYREPTLQKLKDKIEAEQGKTATANDVASRLKGVSVNDVWTFEHLYHKIYSQLRLEVLPPPDESELTKLLIKLVEKNLNESKND